MIRLRIAILFSLLMLVGASFASATSLSFDVVVNTAPLVNNSVDGPFSLDFQLIGTGPNSAVIDSFVFDGGSAVNPPTYIGGATGDLTTGVTLTTTDFLNEFFQEFTAGSSLRFRVNVTSTLTPTPDAFSFSILDKNLQNIPTTGIGDSLLMLTIGPDTGLADIETARGLAVPGGSDFSAVAAGVVPEPASLTLFGTGLVLAVRRLRKAKR